MRLALGLAVGAFLLAVSLANASDPRFGNADQAFRSRKSDTRAFEALNAYRAIWKDSGEKNVEAGWKLAMTCYFAGLRLTRESGQKEKLFREGIEAAVAASKLEPSCAACEFWAAIDTALLGETVGVFKMIASLGEVKARLKRVIELEPAYAYGGAYRLLGLIDQKLPGILGGDNDRARSYFDEAIQAAPDEPLNYLFMARLLADEFSDPAGAESYAVRGLKAKPLDPSRVESFEALKDLEDFLVQLRARPQAPTESAQFRRPGRA